MTHYISPLHDEDLRQAYERAAEYLTGQPVIVRFKKPAAKNADGECYIDEHGIARINIEPGIDVQKSYNILLHEAAHIYKNHAPQLSAADVKHVETLPIFDAREVAKRPEVKKIENEAEQLADEWCEYAHAQIYKSLRYGTTDKTRALMNVNALLNARHLAKAAPAQVCEMCGGKAVKFCTCEFCTDEEYQPDGKPRTGKNLCGKC